MSFTSALTNKFQIARVNSHRNLKEEKILFDIEANIFTMQKTKNI